MKDELLKFLYARFHMQEILYSLDAPFPPEIPVRKLRSARFGVQPLHMLHSEGL